MNKSIRHIAEISLFVSFLFLCNLYSQDKPNIAVSELSGKGISGMDASIVSDFLREALVNTMKFKVLERSNMEQILAEQKFQISGCTSEECAVKLGRLLNVQRVIVGSVSKLDVMYYVSIRMVDVEKGEIVYADSGETDSMKELRGICNQLAGRLAEFEVTKTKVTPEVPKPKIIEKPVEIIPKPLPTFETKIVKTPKLKIYKSKHANRFGIGFHYLGASLRYLTGSLTWELKGVYGDGFSGFGPRIYYNFNPDSNSMVYLALEYCSINGKSNFQTYTGSAFGGFVGCEFFSGNNFSVFTDIGGSNITLNSGFAGVNVSNFHFIYNLGFNVYF